MREWGASPAKLRTTIWTTGSPAWGPHTSWEPRRFCEADTGSFYGFSPLTGSQTGFSQSTHYVSSTDGGLTPDVSKNTLSTPFPQGLLQPPGSSLGLMQGVGLGITFQDPTRQSPATHQFSPSIQRQLSNNLLVDASYIGSRSRNLPALGINQSETSTTGMNINATSVDDLERAYATNGAYFQNKVPNPFQGLMSAGSSINGATVTQEVLLRPYPQFASIRRDGWLILESSNNSLQVRIEKRYGSGLNLSAAYTLSKNIDGTNFNNDYPLASLPVRQLSEIDATHRGSIAGVYELPFGKGRRIAGDAKGAVNHLVGGWRINWLITPSVGLPAQCPRRLGTHRQRQPREQDARPLVQYLLHQLGWRATELPFRRAAGMGCPPGVYAAQHAHPLPRSAGQLAPKF